MCLCICVWSLCVCVMVKVCLSICLSVGEVGPSVGVCPMPWEPDRGWTLL